MIHRRRRLGCELRDVSSRAAFGASPTERPPRTLLFVARRPNSWTVFLYAQQMRAAEPARLCATQRRDQRQRPTASTRQCAMAPPPWSSRRATLAASMSRCVCCGNKAPNAQVLHQRHPYYHAAQMPGRQQKRGGALPLGRLRIGSTKPWRECRALAKTLDNNFQRSDKSSRSRTVTAFTMYDNNPRTQRAETVS